MKLPRLSVVFTLYERPRIVLENVFRSLPIEDASQIILVFDRTPADLRDWVRDTVKFPIEYVELDGPPGIRCPNLAFNAGLERVEHEFTCLFSSEVIHEPQNFRLMRERLSMMPSVVFGYVRDSGEHGPSTTYAKDPMLLCGAEICRPLGFIMGFPTWAMRANNGFDLSFMEGYAFDDDDLSMTLWRFGLPFVWDDAVRGVHQAHLRPRLEGETLSRLNVNRQRMIKKWGHEHPWGAELGKKIFKLPDFAMAIPSNASGLSQKWNQVLEIEAKRQTQK